MTSFLYKAACLIKKKTKDRIVMKFFNLQKIILAPVLMFCLILVSCTNSVAPMYQGPDIKILGQEYYQELEDEFERYSYQLDSLDEGVPPIILKSLPGDISTISSSKQKKIFLL